LDRFGRLRRSVEAADASAQAAQEAANEARLTLVGDVARFYVDARGLQRRIEITRENVQAQQDTAELTAVRFRAGTGTGLDAGRAEAQWQSTLAELPTLEAALRADIHHLSVLTGQPPATFGPRVDIVQPIPQAPADSFSAGVPADILRRRPDIREQERLLEQATASIGVAVADLYPSLTLAGTIGVNSPRANALHRTSLSGVWSIAPQVTLPVLDGGRRRAAVHVQEARLHEVEAQYQTSVLHAEEEVENALVAFSAERPPCKAQAAAAKLNYTSGRRPARLFWLRSAINIASSRACS
jgi:NodT family efflux transporter outer membrane factor (OMF) lipoprotein